MSTPIRSAPPAMMHSRPIVPSSSGLVSLATIPDMTNDRWMAGYSYRTEYPTAALNRSQNTSTVGSNVIAHNGPQFIETIPVALTVRDQLSTFSWRVDDLPPRVTRILDAYTSKLLERELWTGEVAIIDNLPNRILADSDAIDLTPGTLPSVQGGVALLTEALAASGAGDMMIHSGKRTSIMMPDSWLNENTLEMYGFVVVAGSGYPGSGPDGTGSGWLYGTEVVNVRLGPIDVIPGEISQAVDATSNTITYYAQRFGAVDFAGPVFACQVSET
jgi:hypothetical protein